MRILGGEFFGNDLEYLEEKRICRVTKASIRVIRSFMEFDRDRGDDEACSARC